MAVIKNERTKARTSALDDEWAVYNGPVVTLAETLAYAAKRDKAGSDQSSHEKSA